jgi:branched-chain amino acid transport system substrate-binding protein
MIPIRSLWQVGLLLVLVSITNMIDAHSPDPKPSQPASENHPPAEGTIKIGLLIPDQQSLAAKHGAAMAIRQANQAGDRWSFELVTRSCEGLWGAGSKESVSLAFEDNVVAIMGSLDGRNAHLAEQVATKTRIVFLSSWATDMSLSKAFVPWYFRCIPDDLQQASSLAREIFDRKNFKKVATIATGSYDATLAAATFARVTAAMGAESPRQFSYLQKGKDLPEILASIEELGTEAIVLFGDPDFAAGIIYAMRQRGMNQMIFGTLAVTDGLKATGPDWNTLEGAILVSPGHWFTDGGMAFQQAFRETYGYQPGAAAAYAFDGINVILAVIRRAGADRDRIIEAFAGTNHASGITGEIRFDDKGNRAGNACLMTVRNGQPCTVDTE